MTTSKASTDGFTWLTSKTGIDLSRGGVSKALEAFVDERCRLLGCDVERYAQLIEKGAAEEFQDLANRVTIVYTWFFRDPGQMAAIEALLSQWSRQRPMRVWVPGCATGEDAYSIAMMARRQGKPADILGTDLNSRAIEHARNAEYSRWSVRDVAPPYRPYFKRIGRRRYQLDPALRKMVQFRLHNLVDPAPQDHVDGWDLILCRNVLIYFDRERARSVFDQLTQALEVGGHLMLGASEVVYDVPAALCAKYLASRLILERVRPSARPPAGVSGSAPRPRAGAPAGVSPLPLPTADRVKVADSAPERRFLTAATGGNLIPPCGRRSQRPSGAPAALELDSLLLEGNTLLDQGQLDRAQQCFRRAVMQESTSAAARMYFGITLYLCGHIDEAARELRAASLLDADLWPASLYLGLSYESMGLPDDAVREYEHVLRLSEAEQSARPRVHATLGAWHRDLLDLARRRLGLVRPG